MTRKDFQLIARAISVCYTDALKAPSDAERIYRRMALQDVISELACELGAKNPRFDISKFFEAATRESYR